MTAHRLPDDIERRLMAPQPCDERGMRMNEGGYNRPAWTPLGFTRRGQALMLKCERCGRVAPAKLQVLIDRGQGDLPIASFSGKWKCECGSKDVGPTRRAPAS